MGSRDENIQKQAYLLWESDNQNGRVFDADHYWYKAAKKYYSLHLFCLFLNSYSMSSYDSLHALQEQRHQLYQEQFDSLSQQLSVQQHQIDHLIKEIQRLNSTMEQHIQSRLREAFEFSRLILMQKFSSLEILTHFPFLVVQ